MVASGSLIAGPDEAAAAGDGGAAGWAPEVSFTDEDDDYMTITLLAAGLARIREDRRRMDAGEHPRRVTPEQGLLPVPWRSGMVRLWWRFHHAGQPPPRNDLELLELCRVPLGLWPVRLRLSAADQEMSLLDGDELSPLAEQAAQLTMPDVEAELVQNKIYRELMLAAEMNAGNDQDAQAAYVRLRRFLIDHPVISDHQLRGLAGQFPRCSANGQPYVMRLMNTAYVHRPAEGQVRVRVCAGCGNPLSGPGGAGCGTAGCAGEPGEKTLRVLGGYLVQHRAARRFFHDPGLVEARVLDALAACEGTGRIRVEAWPGFDAYDIRVSFRRSGDGTGEPAEVWGADAKDQASPGLLGIGFRWKPDPPCDRRFLVLPAHRARQPGYVADLRTELGGRGSGVTVLDEDRFVAGVKRRAVEVAAG